MRTTAIAAVALVVLSVAVPAGAAGWTDKTATWGLPGGVISSTGNDLYWFSGASVKQYDLGTDSWADLSPAGSPVASASSSARGSASLSDGNTNASAACRYSRTFETAPANTEEDLFG